MAALSVLLALREPESPPLKERETLRGHKEAAVVA
jgi:hypothetical protein